MKIRTRPNHLDCVMPAAGLSSRMGRWKLMLPYQNKTVLDVSIENALSFCSRVILVVGYRSDELVKKYQSCKGVKVVVNPHFKLGMFGSIQQGVQWVESKHFFICHADMPCISSNIFYQTWVNRGEYTVFPGTLTKPGHPVLLPSTIKQNIIDADINQSMKAIIYRYSVKYLNLGSDSIYFDVDTPEAYKQLCEQEH
ncbi:molybdenum cofactor cytidylyltransferase [Photobacterium makurazakiensis]|uniref:molybdenum cofactor cytidylyltransferase n=1 Tax=Photobacterium makurazakiensis TaxID=2910234 RepID=UPI003D14DE19